MQRTSEANVELVGGGVQGKAGPKNSKVQFVKVAKKIKTKGSTVLTRLTSGPNVEIVLTSRVTRSLVRPKARYFRGLGRGFTKSSVCRPSKSFSHTRLTTIVFSSSQGERRLGTVMRPTIQRCILRRGRARRQTKGLFLLILRTTLLVRRRCSRVYSRL